MSDPAGGLSPEERFREDAEAILKDFEDADIPTAREAAQKLKQAALQIPKASRGKELAFYFEKLRDIILKITICEDDGTIAIGGPPDTADKFPEGEMYLFDALESLVESAKELLPMKERKLALAAAYLEYRKIVSEKYADDKIGSYDAEAFLQDAADSLLPQKKRDIAALRKIWKADIKADIHRVEAGVQSAGVDDKKAKDAALRLHIKFNLLAEGPRKPTKNFSGVEMDAIKNDTGPVCRMNGQILRFKNLTDRKGMPVIALGSQFGGPEQVLKVIEQIYPEDGSETDKIFRKKYEQKLALLIDENTRTPEPVAFGCLL